MLTLERCKSWNPEWRSLEKLPRKSQRRSVQTLDAQAENIRNYLVLQRNMIPAQKHAAEKMEQATRVTKWRRKKSKIGWTAAGLRKRGDETKRANIDRD